MWKGKEKSVLTVGRRPSRRVGDARICRACQELLGWGPGEDESATRLGLLQAVSPSAWMKWAQ